MLGQVKKIKIEVSPKSLVIIAIKSSLELWEKKTDNVVRVSPLPMSYATSPLIHAGPQVNK